MAPISASNCLAGTIRDYGVTHVFHVPAVVHLAVAEMDAMGITPVTTHSEVSAAYMADGYARARRGPGVCLAQAAGASNLAAGLRDPYLACSPVIAITGGPHPDTRYRYLYQEIEDFTQYQAVTKSNVRVERMDRLSDLLRQAFRTATSGSPGPTHLEIPGRLGESIRCDIGSAVPGEERFGHVPPFRPAPEPADVRQAIALLAAAERPVIIAGGGVVASDAAAELVQLAELLSIPVATSLNGKGTIADSHPLSLGVSGTYGRFSTNRALAEADLVFFIGSRAGGHTTDNWRAPRPGTRVIQLDVEPVELGRNYSLAAAILGDAKVSLRQIIEAAAGVKPTNRGPWLKTTRELTASWLAAVEGMSSSDATPMRPERLCRELTEALPANGVVVVDTGHAAIWTGTLLELNKPGQRYIRCAGSLGWGFPGSIGVKCALPDSTVVCFTGDGGFFYHLSELETAARMGINVVAVVNNNGALGQTKHGWDVAYGDSLKGPARDKWIFRKTNFAAVAESLGCLGIRVEEPSALRGAFDRAFSANRPVVVDVATAIEAMPLAPWG
ncbi:MAG: thiamine pyrophosphate-binding protein [Chloroflexota bacterium]